jgi:hypothetical protein
MAHVSSFVYAFFCIAAADEYIGFCTEAEVEDYLNELLTDGYSLADLTWDIELWEDQLPDYPE